MSSRLSDPRTIHLVSFGTSMPRLLRLVYASLFLILGSMSSLLAQDENPPNCVRACTSPAMFWVVPPEDQTICVDEDFSTPPGAVEGNAEAVYVWNGKPPCPPDETETKTKPDLIVDDSEVDTSKPGVYYITYSLTATGQDCVDIGEPAKVKVTVNDVNILDSPSKAQIKDKDVLIYAGYKLKALGAPDPDSDKYSWSGAGGSNWEPNNKVSAKNTDMIVGTTGGDKKDISVEFKSCTDSFNINLIEPKNVRTDHGGISTTVIVRVSNRSSYPVKIIDTLVEYSAYDAYNEAVAQDVLRGTSSPRRVKLTYRETFNWTGVPSVVSSVNNSNLHTTPDYRNSHSNKLRDRLDLSFDNGTYRAVNNAIKESRWTSMLLLGIEPHDWYMGVVKDGAKTPVYFEKKILSNSFTVNATVVERTGGPEYINDITRQPTRVMITIKYTINQL